MNSIDSNQSVPVSCGAVWRRVDLHLHSPGVNSFTLPDGADTRNEAGRAKIVQQYVEQLAAQQIEIAAITDYNGIRREWFEPIREVASTYSINVLSGVELSFNYGRNGLHVLAIFEKSASIGEINSFIQSFDRDPATALFDGRNHRDITPRDHIIDALKSLRNRFHCLLIPPHPSQNKGALKAFQPKDAADFLRELKPDAVEHCPDNEIARLNSLLDSDYLGRVSWVEFSDPKSIADIGSKQRNDSIRRATYLKLSATDLDAIRFALHDPQTRVHVGELPESLHVRIKHMDVAGAGFLGNLTVAWNDYLNTVIGGRGAGKSALLECLRYALQLQPYTDHQQRQELVRHALGSGGKVTVVIERPMSSGSTRAYRVERVFGDEARVYELDTDRSIPAQPAELFGPGHCPVIFGQREIYAVSESEENRLRLLDELIGEEAPRRAKEVRNALETLRANARDIVEAQKKLAKREECRQRLKTIEHEIGIYEEHGVAEKLRMATALRSDDQVLKGADEAVQQAEEIWRQACTEVVDPLLTRMAALRQGQSVQKELLATAAVVLEQLESGLRGLCAQGETFFIDSITKLQGIEHRWQAERIPLEQELAKIKQEIQSETLDPDRLLRLTEERTALAPLLAELDRVEAGLTELRNKRRDLFTAVQNRRLEEHQLRRERAETIAAMLDGRLRLTVEFKGHKDDYSKQLGALLKGSGVTADAIQKLVEPEATDGMVLARSIQAGMAAVQDRFNITPAMAERLVRWFTEENTRLFELETLIPADTLLVELRVDSTYRPLDRLSVGQRATAILLLLFALEGRVLVLDQPEDDLDNRFVYEDIVTLLRQQKGGTALAQARQIIMATHNANIPVLGDAELVLPLEAQAGRAHVISRGSIDEATTRQLIKALMEGGEAAFQRRAEKYGARWS